MEEVYLLLGGNLGDREWYISEAVKRINECAGAVEQVSSYYETPSWGKTDQPDFLNQAIFLKTRLAPEELLNAVLEIERQLGRKRGVKWGSRTIDIDIMFYSDQIIRQSDLVIPHPYLHERAFALIPLAEIAPDKIHPVCRKSILELSKLVSDRLSVKKIDKINLS